MAVEPLYKDLFAVALSHTQLAAFDKCLELAEATSRRVAGLTAAQISGLAELANISYSVAAISAAVQEREKKRWQKKGNPGPGSQIEEDINKLKQVAQVAVEQAEVELSRALGKPETGKRPTGRNWIGELHLALARRYLVAVTMLARIDSSAAHQFEKES